MHLLCPASETDIVKDTLVQLLRNFFPGRTAVEPFARMEARLAARAPPPLIPALVPTWKQAGGLKEKRGCCFGCTHVALGPVSTVRGAWRLSLVCLGRKGIAMPSRHDLLHFLCLSMGTCSAAIILTAPCCFFRFTVLRAQTLGVCSSPRSQLRRGSRGGVLRLRSRPRARQQQEQQDQ
jgi:hypothetical protein